SAGMPWLYLMRDGAYQWGADAGTFQIRDGQLLLSGSYKEWGPGRFDEERRLAFAFTREGKKLAVTLGYRGSIEEYPPPARK
ncbi:MAG: hypothetical protein HZA54_14060, partial [Planctomycetes bacterium]|nr:hypothetical protein [Planctomycetota bacterium]